LGSKGSQTTTSTSSTAPDPQAYAAYSDLLKRAAGVAATPYQSYSGELTAPVNAQQTQGIAGVNANANYAQPFIGQAADYANQAAAPITGQQIAQYSDPFTQQVINATQAQFSDQNAQQQSALTGNAIAQGALGGNRVGVAQANLAGQQQRAQAPVIAGLASQGYQTGLQTALAQQQAKAQAAYSLGNLGVAGQNAALTGAGAQIGAGTLEQGTQQAADAAKYGQFQQQQAYPFQTAQWLAGLDTGVGSQMGGTSNGTQTQPGASPWNSIIGGGLTLASMFLKNGGGVAAHYDQGGGVGGTPYAGVAGWVPSIGISAGRGAPNAPNTAAPQKQQQLDPTKIAQQASGLVDKIKSGFGYGDPLDLTPPGVASGFGGDSSGYAYAGGPDSGLGGLYADGGLVQGVGRYDYGGGVPSPFDDFGGDANNAPTDIPAALAPAGLGPIDSGPAIAQTAGVTPFSPTPDVAAVKGDQLPVAGGVAPPMPAPIDVAQHPGDAGTGVNVPMAADAGVQRAPVPVAGVGPAPIQSDPQADYGMDHFKHAIGSIESSNNYAAVTDTGKGDAAYGRYQVTGANIPVWTREVLGVSMTPQQFLHNPQAQDAVFEAKFGSYLAKTGNPDDAASMWFSGRPIAQAGHAHDILGTSVPDYVRKFRTALGQTAGVDYADNNAGVSGAGSDRVPVNAALAQGVAPAGVAPAQKSGFGLGLLDKDQRMALMAAGLGIMASPAHNVGQAIGEGGLMGVKSYTAAQANEAKNSIANRKVDLDAQRLSQSADKAQKDLDLRTKALALQSQKVGQAQLKMIKNPDYSETPVLYHPADGSLTTPDGKPYAAPTTSGASDIAEAIKKGLQPPTTTGLYRQGAQVRTQLARDGFDLASANQQWEAAQKQIKSLNGPQMVRYAGLAHSVINTIDEVNSLAQKMQNTGVPAYNHARLMAYAQAAGNTEGGQLAARYLAATNTLKEEFANLAQGGYAPTEAAWGLANQQINADYGVKQLGATLGEVQRLIRYRIQGIPNFQRLGPGAANRYTGATQETIVGGPQSGGGTAPSPAAPVYREGQTATGRDGRKLTYHNGRWE
jgi:hypothetical protein